MTYRKTARTTRHKRRAEKVRVAKAYAVCSILCTTLAFLAMFFAAYFHDKGQSAPEALTCFVGMVVFAAGSLVMIVAAQEELSS